MIKALENEKYRLNVEHYVKDFGKRFMNLLGFEFKKLSPALALEILEYTNRKKENADR